MQEGSLFSTHSPAFVICRLLNDGHSDQCEVVPHCSFDLHFSYLAMLSIFSCAYWPSVCLLWRNVYLGLLSIFWFGWFFVIELSWAVRIFWKVSPCWSHCSQIFSPSPYVVFSFWLWFPLLCKSLQVWLGASCLFLLLFLLSWESDLRKHWYNLCQRMFCLCSLLGVLWCHVLHWSL